MSNVRELRTQARRFDEASIWIAKLDAGLSEADSVTLARWLAEHPDNSTVLQRMAYVWDKMDVMSRLAEVVPHPAPNVVARPTVWLTAAASVLVAALTVAWGMGALSWMNIGDAENSVLAATEPTVYETAVGGQSTIELSDGTQILLNTNSRIRVNYAGQRRVVWLERGEMHINVAHDVARPLSVVAGMRVMQAVGTAFTVKIDSAQQVELVVTEGRVRVGVRPVRTSGNESDALAPALLPDSSPSLGKGQEIMLGATDEEIKTLVPEDIEVRLSWRNGNLIFRGEALGDAVAEISRYTAVEFVFLTDDLQKVRIAGLFKAGDVVGFLAALQANFDIASERIENNKILLKAAAKDVR